MDSLAVTLAKPLLAYLCIRDYKEGHGLGASLEALVSHTPWQQNYGDYEMDLPLQTTSNSQATYRAHLTVP